jgi:SAM-dependent methyltransferase
MPSPLTSALKSSLVRALWPPEAWRVYRLQKDRKKALPERARHDPQLELYSRILRRDFLHYGYFTDPDVAPEAISLRDIEEAQLEYARQFLRHLRPEDRARPVLDAGCGMGGLSVLLRDEGFQPVALTPDAHQVRYINEKHANVPTLHCKLEELDPAAHRQRFGTVITSESLQYLRLDAALPVIEQVLAPGGRWLICDYFRKQPHANEKSGHVLDAFLEQARAAGWRVDVDTDITPNILVSLKYLRMLADRMLLPLVEFGVRKVRVKHPGWAHLLRDVLPQLEQKVHDGVEVIDPKRFAAEKTYRFLVLSRA